MPARPTEGGRALFYTRDSGGEHEMTPNEYVRWAKRAAVEHRAVFTGTPEQIERLMRSRESFRSGDVYLDYGVEGHLLTRPGLRCLYPDGDVRLKRVSRPQFPDGTGLPDPKVL